MSSDVAEQERGVALGVDRVLLLRHDEHFSSLYNNDGMEAHITPDPDQHHSAEQESTAVR